MMSSRPSTLRRPSNLSIQPPSPHQAPPPLTTPNNPYPSHPSYPAYTSYSSQGSYPNSPRKAPLPPSPTYSTTSFASTNTKGSSGLGSNAPGIEFPPPLPYKTEKRLPPPPPLSIDTSRDGDDRSLLGGSRGSPHSHRGGGKGLAGTVGVYDNKLVSSTLSHLPPLPPLSPSPSSTSYSNPLYSLNPLSQLSQPSLPSLHASSSSNSRPPLPTSSSGVLIFGDGTPLSDHAHSHALTHENLPLVERTLAHSSPSSPWSLLTVHVLPLFAGSALKTPIEDLNQLCNSHIISTSQRSPQSRVVAILSSDLREFIASGMLTLKSKFETLEEAKVVSRAAEVWSFFWAQVLPYVEGVFLPFTQLRDVPSTATGSASYLSSLSSPIPVRHLLLSGFLLHILLPLLPRLIPRIASSPPAAAANLPTPTSSDLARILQMSLVLSTQARYSAFFPSARGGSVDRDEEVRENVESLHRAVRWRTQQNELDAEAQAASTAAPPGTGAGAGGTGDSPLRTATTAGGRVQRNQSLTQSGRYRRRGWRASANVSALGFGQLGPGQPGGAGGINMSRQDSDGGPYASGVGAGAGAGVPGGAGGVGTMQDRWGRPRLDEDDEEDDYTPINTQGMGLAPPPRVRTDTSDSMTLSVPASMISGTSSSSSTATATSAATGMSTLTAGTVRGESLASYGEYGETPTTSASASATQSGIGTRGEMYGAANGRPRRMREGSAGSSDLGPAPPAEVRRWRT